MKRVLMLGLVVLLCLASAAGAADDIYRLIEEGKLAEAREALGKVSTAALRNGNNLFFQALLETDGARSAQLMEVALNSSVDTEYREIIFLRLAQYYYLTGDFKKLHRLIVDYRVTFESGRFRPQMLRYSAVVDEQQKRHETALRQVDRYLLENSGGEAEQWGEIDKARILIHNGKDIGARKMLEKLSRLKSGPGVAQALYLLTQEAVREKRADDAVFYYNILREGYPAAVGLDALVERMSDLSSSTGGREDEADQITGTFYSVQVGVFSEEDNAERMADRFKGYGHKIDIARKTVSGVRYHVVYVGRFDSYYEASAVKTKLEAEHSEVFQVVAR